MERNRSDIASEQVASPFGAIHMEFSKHETTINVTLHSFIRFRSMKTAF